MQIFGERKADYAVIDVETTKIKKGERPRTKFWGYADSKGYKRFETTEKLIKFLEKEPAKILLHHSNFDIIQLLVDGVFDISIIRSHAGKLIRCGRGQHTFQNTLTTFPVSLKQIFHAFGYEKTELSNLAKRNYEDCVNGLDCFLKLDSLFFDLVGVSPLQVGTVAGTTFRAAEKHAGKMPKNTDYLVAYRGGRVEVFSTVRQMASKLDIHSSYPRSFLEAPRTDELLYVEVKTRDWHCPLFEAKTEDLLFFPNGRFRSYVFRSNWERYIEPFAEKTSIRILHREKLDFTWLCELNELVRTIYRQKSEAKSDGVKLCCKFLLNAFYGRIGLKGESERARILDAEPDGDDITYYSLGKNKWIAFDTVQRETRSNYPFAAYITDNARARIYRAFKRNNPLYGDTDSIFTPIKRSEFKEPISPDCGDWGYEGRKMFAARNVKDYEWNGEDVVKGGTPGKEFLTWTFKTFASGKTVTAMIRQRQGTLRKRIVLPSGETEPIVVN